MDIRKKYSWLRFTSFFYKKPATIGLKWDIKVLKIKRHPFKKADLDGSVVGHDPCSRPNEREKEL